MWNLGLLGASVGGAAAGDFDLLETTILTADAASVSFTGLDSYTDYEHLQLRIVANHDLATLREHELVVNGDTTSSYSRHGIEGRNNDIVSVNGFNENSCRVAWIGHGTNFYSGAVIDILDAFKATKFTTIKGFSGFHFNTGYDQMIALNSSAYLKTNTITSLAFNPRGGASNYTTGSRFSLYGIKAA